MKQATEHVILVDERNRELGADEKLRAHQAGALHRAFSVFVFDRGGRLLLQRRAREKYHSGGLWSNTACGHPRPGEGTAEAARRRLREEMGFECELRGAFHFVYRAAMSLTFPASFMLAAAMNPCRSADFMSDMLWHGRRHRTFKIVDNFDCEGLR